MTLLDSTCLIVGIIISVSICQMAQAAIAGQAVRKVCYQGSGLLGGLLSLCGALSYARLCMPQEGGDICYLNRARAGRGRFLFN
ncbi:MAG: hypothetical protein HS113_13300 [Verrucomicrobiales bacterium]|nr:hypothetical protein [Verrucomicrobiales bacterium]